MVRRSLLVAALSSLAVPAAHAAERAKKVDVELLEFLGSIDAEEEGWQEYLEQKPVKPASTTPQKSAPPHASTDPKQVNPK